MVLVDSSLWVDFLRVRVDRVVRETVDAWLADERVAICAPVFAEVLRGARKPDVRRVRATLDALHYFETTDDDWQGVIRHARALSDVAQHVPLVDLAIAVVAHRNDALLAHRDRHYEAIATVLPVRQQYVG